MLQEEIHAERQAREDHWAVHALEDFPDETPTVLKAELPEPVSIFPSLILSKEAL